MTRTAAAIPSCRFPAHSDPRVWLLSSGASPIGIALSRQLLAHGDFVVLGVTLSESMGSLVRRSADFAAFWTGEVLLKEEWKTRARVVALDARCEPGLCTVRQGFGVLMSTLQECGPMSSRRC